jgi:hypothetical protein
VGCASSATPVRTTAAHTAAATAAASQNLNGAHVRVPGFWSGPEMDRFAWDKDCGGIVNQERTQNLPAVLTARLQAETLSSRMAYGDLPQVAEFNTPRSMDAVGECSAYDGFKAYKIV